MSVQTSIHERHELDPITFEVLRNAYVNICNEMGITLAKVSYSPIIKEGKDFSGALFTKEGHLVACGQQDLPSLLGTMEATIGLVLDTIPPHEMYPGDVILVNSPHEGGSHLNDVRAIRPVFSDSELVAFVGDLGHWTDVGGATPGSINPLAADCFSEGINISPVKLVERSTIRRDVLNLILNNCRLPSETRGDIHAQVKTLEVGDRRLQHFLDKYGIDAILRSFEAIFDYTEQLLYHETSTMQDGSYYFEDRLDEDPDDPEHNPLFVRLSFTKRGDDYIFDFSQSDPDPKAALGCGRPFTCSAVAVAFLNLYPGIPFNHGVTRKLEVVTKPGTLNHAVFPSSVSGAAAGAFDKSIGAVFGAIGQADPSRAVGCCCNLYNVLGGGEDERFHRPYVFYVWNEGGYGGSPRGDGGDTPMLFPYAAGTRNQPVEVHERWFPMLYRAIQINYGACGAGEFRGGPGVIRSFELTHGTASYNVWGDRSRFPPWGTHGGLTGGAHRVWVNKGQPDEQEVRLYSAGLPLRRGETVEIWSGGGGGYGHPFDRNPERVLNDVVEGIVSEALAEAIYGVKVICRGTILRDFTIDEETTRLLRSDRPSTAELQRRALHFQWGAEPDSPAE